MKSDQNVGWTKSCKRLPAMKDRIMEIINTQDLSFRQILTNAVRIAIRRSIIPSIPNPRTALNQSVNIKVLFIRN